MCSKIFAIVFVVVALLLAISASLLPQDRLATIIYITRFFDIMLPVLAVGALVKYLFCYHYSHSCKNSDSKVGPTK